MLPSYNLVLAKATKLQNKEKLRLTKNKMWILYLTIKRK